MREQEFIIDQDWASISEGSCPFKELWAEVAKQMVWDWVHLVIDKKTLYPFQIPFPVRTGRKQNRSDITNSPEFREVVIEVLAEDIFSDEDRVGNMFWICREIFGDDWETRLEAIRDNLKSSTTIKPFRKAAKYSD